MQKRPGNDSGAGHSVEAPIAGYSLEGVRSAVLELDPRPHHQILDGARDEHLSGRGLGAHTGTDVDSHAGNVIPMQLALAGVEPRPNVDPQSVDLVGDRAAAADPPCGSVERRQEAVPHGLDLTTVEAAELMANEVVVFLYNRPPAAVAQACGA